MTLRAARSEPGDPASPEPLRAPRLLARLLFIGVAPVVAYGAVRPFVASDALGLAVAGAIPVSYGVIVAVVLRRVDVPALLASIGYGLGCLLSLLLGGSALPLKLHEAFVTGAVGLVLVVAVTIRRPIPLGRIFRLPNRRLDATLGVMIGGFLILHALLHIALAVTLSTSAYVVMSRVVNWITIAVGAMWLSAYLRHARPSPSTSGRTREVSHE